MSAALLFGEPLAGNVVALMYAGGQLLESFAEGRARREMTALLGRVAFTAMRYRDTTLEEVPVATIRQGDRLLVRQVVRAMNQEGGADVATAAWGPMRLVFLTYGSDPLAAFAFTSAIRPPEWASNPQGPLT